MKKYNVVFAVSYTIEAEDEEDAIEDATNQMIDEFGEGMRVNVSAFGINATEV